MQPCCRTVSARLGLHVPPHVLAHDGAAGEQRVPHDGVHACVAQRAHIVRQRLRHLPCGGLDGVGIVVQIHVQILLVAQHGQRTQRAEHKGHNGHPALLGLHQTAAYVDVHHHPPAGAVVHLFDLGVVLDLPDHRIAVVRMRRLVLRKDQLLPPGVALNGQVDKRHQAVQIEQLRRFQKACRARLRVGGPFFIGGVHQLPVDAAQNGVHRYMIGLLMAQGGRYTLKRSHIISAFPDTRYCASYRFMALL